RRHTCVSRDWSSDVCSSDLGYRCPGIGGGSGSRGGRDSDRVQVEVLLVREYLQNMLAGGNWHAVLADPLECVPPSGVGHDDQSRSEERRVGKEGGSRWARDA